MRKYNLSGDYISVPKGSNLILSNHVTNVDFLLINSMTKGTYMNFVLAENAFRNGLLNKVINSINDPIIHVKGSNSLSTIKDITKNIKKGNNVMLFPEGNTSFNGCTAKLDENIGKLVRLCYANLVMIRIKGGYLSRPRWGTIFRKGTISFESTSITADELKKMSVSEITDMINKNIYTDAYEEQDNSKKEFISKKSCLGIERAMYKCPRCNEIGTLKSNDDSVACKCGYVGHYDKYGYITDELMAQHSVKEYLFEQRTWLKEIVGRVDSSNLNSEPSLEEAVLFKDIVSVKDITDESNLECRQFLITAYKNFSICKCIDSTKDDIIIPYKNVNNVTIFKANTMTVFVKENDKEKACEKIYEVTGEFSFNALKYRDLFEIISEE